MYEVWKSYCCLYSQKCQNQTCSHLLFCNQMTCPECKFKQVAVGKRAIDYKPVGKTCLTTEKYQIHGRVRVKDFFLKLVNFYVQICLNFGTFQRLVDLLGVFSSFFQNSLLGAWLETSFALRKLWKSQYRFEMSTFQFLYAKNWNIWTKQAKHWGLREQHHHHGFVVYLTENGNGHSIDHNTEGGFFPWFLKEDKEGKNFLEYLKERFVECELF